MLKDWRHTPATRHILAYGSLATTHLRFVVDVCDWLKARGLPLYRTNLYTPTLHPLMQGVGCIWRRDGRHEEQIQPHWGETRDESAWRESPIRKILDGVDELRFDLCHGPDRFGVPLLDELRAEGGSEYLVFAVPYADGRRSAISWTTDAPTGFSLRERNELRNLAGPMGLVLDLLEWRRTARTLLDTYLGRGPGQEVLNGAIRRGDHRDIDAVMMMTDLRDSTALSSEGTVATFLEALDSYFEALVDAVMAADGDVLQFRGDGLLAIFPITPRTDIVALCHRVLDATLEARQRMDQINQMRLSVRAAALEFCTALHVGRMTYGNIGGRGRLAFTVVGRAVNLLSRVETLCKTTGNSTLATAAFGSRLGDRMVSIGRHAMRGLDQPVELFALPTQDRPAARPRQSPQPACS